MAISVEEARAMTEEQLQETITEIAFEIIANVGTARGMYIEAIQEAKAGHFDQAEQLMKDGKEAFVQGHHGHADLLEWQGQGLTWKTNIFPDACRGSADGCRRLRDHRQRVHRSTPGTAGAEIP